MNINLISKITPDDHVAAMVKALNAADGLKVESEFDEESRAVSHKVIRKGEVIFFAMRGTSDYLVRKPAKLFV